MTSEIIFRRYHPGDEKQIVDLINRNFNLERDLHWWKWFYQNHVNGLPIQYVAEYQGKIISHRAFVPYHFTKGNNNIIAGQACDSVTDQGFRRKGIFSQLLNLATLEAREREWNFLYSFAGPMSYAGYIKAGWEKSFEISRLIKIINYENTLNKLSTNQLLLQILTNMHKAGLYTFSYVHKGRSNSDFRYQIIEASFDHENMSFLNQQITRNCWMTKRTQAYLSWRYGFQSREYRTFFIMEEQKPIGYFVLNIVSKYGLKTGVILDVAYENRLLEPVVIKYIHNFFRDMHVDLITCWITNNRKNWYSEGFIPSPLYKTSFVKLNLKAFNDSEKFCLCLGDTDAY